VLSEAKVGIAPGYTFGTGNADHVRLCIAIASDRLEDALQRLIAVLDR
jgi:bifunctional pyridoxal-dependent enzyme with beta-cystathionase and maltose regulon repressor activities